MLLEFMSSPDFITKFLIVGIVMIIALIFHNVFQAWVAKILGDPTPTNLGYANFDPQTHLDPYGVIFLALLGFGWPKNVPVNSRNLKGKKEALVWYAGPLAYFIVALLTSAVALLFFKMGKITLATSFSAAASYAIIHAVYNLLPVYPLDGAKAALVWGNNDIRRVIRQIQSWGLLGFIGAIVILNFLGITPRLIIFFQNLINSILSPFLKIF